MSDIEVKRAMYLDPVDACFEEAATVMDWLARTLHHLEARRIENRKSRNADGRDASARVSANGIGGCVMCDIIMHAHPNMLETIRHGLASTAGPFWWASHSSIVPPTNC